MKRKPTLLESCLPIIVMLLLLAIGYGVFGLSPEPLLILSSIFAGFIAMRLGVSWDEMLEGIQEKLNMAMPAILVLISDRKSTRLNSSHVSISYAVFC